MSETATNTVGVTASAIASKTTYFGATSGFVAWLASIDVLAWLGIAIALGGFFINWYYKRLENKRADEIHQLEIKKLQEVCDVKQD